MTSVSHMVLPMRELVRIEEFKPCRNKAAEWWWHCVLCGDDDLMRAVETKDEATRDAVAHLIQDHDGCCPERREEGWHQR